jgi:hypothetical protein
MSQLPADKLRLEFRSDIKDLKIELSQDLEAAVCRIEKAIQAHSESSRARQTDITQRIDSHENRMQDGFHKIMEWRILVETRLAAQAQQNRVSAAVFGSIGAAILSLIVRLAACSPDTSPPMPIPALPPMDTSSPSRRN